MEIKQANLTFKRDHTKRAKTKRIAVHHSASGASTTIMDIQAWHHARLLRHRLSLRDLCQWWGHLPGPSGVGHPGRPCLLAETMTALGICPMWQLRDGQTDA